MSPEAMNFLRYRYWLEANEDSPHWSGSYLDSVRDSVRLQAASLIGWMA